LQLLVQAAISIKVKRTTYGRLGLLCLIYTAAAWAQDDSISALKNDLAQFEREATLVAELGRRVQWLGLAAIFLTFTTAAVQAWNRDWVKRVTVVLAALAGLVTGIKTQVVKIEHETCFAAVVQIRDSARKIRERFRVYESSPPAGKPRVVEEISGQLAELEKLAKVYRPALVSLNYQTVAHAQAPTPAQVQMRDKQIQQTAPSQYLSADAVAMASDWPKATEYARFLAAENLTKRLSFNSVGIDPAAFLAYVERNMSVRDLRKKESKEFVECGMSVEIRKLLTNYDIVKESVKPLNRRYLVDSRPVPFDGGRNRFPVVVVRSGGARDGANASFRFSFVVEGPVLRLWEIAVEEDGFSADGSELWEFLVEVPGTAGIRVPLNAYQSGSRIRIYPEHRRSVAFSGLAGTVKVSGWHP
jgi:hypothetical protein